MAYSYGPSHHFLRSGQIDVYRQNQPPITNEAFQVNSPFVPPPFHSINRFLNAPNLLPALQQPQARTFLQHIAGTPFMGSDRMDELYLRNEPAAPHFGMAVQHPQVQNDLPPPEFDVSAMPPFEDASWKFKPTSYGVIRVKNIPYSVTKSEITHFLGRHTPMIESHTQGNPIHIIMERSTAKTMDCYVELQTPYDAEAAVHRHENLVVSGKHPKLGTRHVGLELASQNDLLADLFPRAKCIVWRNGEPIKMPNNDPYSSGFNGLFTNEEMVGLVRHAQNPQRSPFSAKCLQRTFECMISTCYKMPWYSTQLITLRARNQLFETYMAQLVVLVERVGDRETVGLDHKLLLDFIFAGVNCPGFGERQKFEIVATAGEYGGGVCVGMLSCFWPFEVVGKRMGAAYTDDVVRFYLNLIELGVQVHISQHNDPDNSPFPNAELIDFRLSSARQSTDPMVINNTHFYFTEAALEQSLESLLTMELELMRLLLEMGWNCWQQQHGYAGLAICTATEPPRQPDSDAVNLQEASNTQMVRHKGDVREDQEQDQAGDHEDIEDADRHDARTPMRNQTPISCGCSPPESPKGTIIPDADDITKTPHKPITSTFASMSAKQPITTKIDPTVIPFRPRQSSDPTMFTNAEDREGTLGFGLGGLGNGGFADIVARSRSQDLGGQDLTTVIDETREEKQKLHQFPTRARRCGSAAVPMRHPDGTTIDFNFDNLSIEEEPTTNVPIFPRTNNTNTTAQLSPPKLARRRSGSSPRSTSPSFSVAVGSTPTKTSNRKLITIASTIHEDEGEDEEALMMNGGTKSSKGKLNRELSRAFGIVNG